MSEEQGQSAYAIPVSIIIAGVMIAGAVYLGQSNTPTQPSTGDPSDQAAQTAALNQSRADSIATLIKTVPIADESDHIVGNPRAKVAIIEYSDIECPYCQVFQQTMQEVMAKYGASGEVAWIYRPFPLDIHPDAYPEALAAECVTADAGNVKYWQFINELMTISASQIKVDAKGEYTRTAIPVNEKITTAAKKLSLDSAKILACVTAETFKQKLVGWRADALAAGLGQNKTGTPFSVIIAGDQRYFIDGAQEYATIEAMIKKPLGK